MFYMFEIWCGQVVRQNFYSAHKWVWFEEESFLIVLTWSNVVWKLTQLPQPFLLLRNLYTLIKITWAYLQLERGCSVGSSFSWVCKFLTVCFKNTMYSAAFVKISIFVLKSLLLGRSSFKTVKAFRSTFTRLCSLLFFLTRLCSMLLISFRAPSWYTSTVYIDFP